MGSNLSSAGKKDLLKTPHGCKLYGKNNFASCVLFRQMDKDLIEYFLKQVKIFNCSADELVKLGFKACVDHPQLPDHIYYEGYFHSYNTDEPIESINPRNTRTFNKPAAPKLLRSFYIAFRDKNKLKFEAITTKILNIKNTAEEDKKLIADLFILETLCGDLAIQIHAGTGVSYDDIAWHCDAVNSLFHMAISIRGKRDLYSYLSQTKTDEDRNIFVDNLNQNDVYISSPYGYFHGVSYPEQKWENRTIAT